MSSFSRAYNTQHTLGAVILAAVYFLKMMFMIHCDFDTGSLKINIFKVLFWEGGGGSRIGVICCVLLTKLTILDDEFVVTMSWTTQAVSLETSIC